MQEAVRYVDCAARLFHPRRQRHHSRIMRCLVAILVGVFLAVSGGCSGLFYHPDRQMYYPPDKNGYSPRNVWFKSGDGTKLHGWYFESKTKPVKGTIVQFHGNAQNISSHYASLVWLTKHGYNLFTFDYRGYGLSEGEPSQEGTYKDGMAALDQAWEIYRRDKNPPRFIVYGQSLGGIIAMRSFVDFRHRGSTDLLVLDSTFVSYDTVARQTLAKNWFTWLFQPLGSLLVSDKYSVEEIVPKFKTPVLIIHDKKDPVVNYDNAEKLYSLVNAERKLWTLEQGRHIGVFAEDNPENREKFLRILQRFR